MKKARLQTVINHRLRYLVAICLLLNFFAFACSQKGEIKERNPYNLDLVQTLADYQKLVAENADNTMVDLETVIPGIVLDIRYATANNFTGKIIYTAPKAFARNPVAEALKSVQDSLSKHQLALKIYDAYRPYSASLLFYKVYPDTSFVADPKKGSRHNRGCAIDLTLIELLSGKEIPMPSEFDDFSAKANPEYANLPDTVLANRKFLFGVMEHFGFKHIASEWWHFDFNGWSKYKLMDLPFEDLERGI